MLLEACLNGGRTPAEHPAIPRTPAELAAEARASVEAGAQVLHLHPYDGSGSQTLAAHPCHPAAREVLADAGIGLEQVHHGDGVANWHVMARAVRRGHGTRAGLEDTTVLPDGRLAPDNASLVRVAARMLRDGDWTDTHSG